MSEFLFALARPKGLWEWLILDVLSFISNYGLRVIFLIVALKLLMFPIDFYQRKSGIDNAKKMKQMKPEMDKLQEMYGADRALMFEKQRQLQRKYNYRPFSACLPMILTMVIFITLFNGFRLISAYQNQVMMDSLYTEYTRYYTDNTEMTLAELNATLDEMYDNNPQGAKYTATDADLVLIQGASAELDDQVRVATAKKLFAQRKVQELYESDAKESFFLVKNIWRSDMPWTNPIPTQNEMETSITHKRLPETADWTAERKNEILSNYNDFMKLVREAHSSGAAKANGYMFWALLAIGLSFVQQFLMMRQQKAQGTDMSAMGGGGSMKMMMWIMPVMIAVFALTSAASFTIYMVVNSGIGLVSNLGSGAIVKKVSNIKDEKAEQEVANVGVRSVRGIRKK